MGCCLTVQTQTVGVLENWGRFDHLLTPGCHCINPCGDSIVARVSLRVQQLDVKVETKTSDNVFVQAVVSVQYQVQPETVYEAHYKLSNPESQIRAYVFDVVRATVPTITLDNVFSKKDEIAIAVKQELAKVMESYGYLIVQALVTDIDPDERVKKSMNEINAAARLRAAATDKAEAEKIALIKAAEADAESKFLSGQGIARQRKAIVDGLRESVLAFADNVEGTTPKDVMDLVLMTQYFDTMKEIAGTSRSSTVFLNHNPGAVGDVASQIREGFLSAGPGMKQPATLDSQHMHRQ